MNKQQLANKIWASANKMRSKIEANEYKDYILGLIFYKFLSDNEVNYLKSIGWTDEDLVTLVEDHDNQEAVMMMEYCRNNIGYFIEYKNLFGTWLKPNSEFSVADLSGALNSFDRLISPNYKHVYENIFKTLQAGLSKLGENTASQTRALKNLIKLIKDIPTDGSQDYDVLGYVYEYLISNFAANAGKKAGEFYTPHEVAILMSEIVAEHHKDKDKIEIYDPTSGSGSLLITIGKSIGRHIEDKNKVKYYAQELKENTYNLTRMNLVMRGIKPDNINTRCADSLEEDLDQESCIYADKVRSLRQKEYDNASLYSETDAEQAEQLERSRCNFIEYFDHVQRLRHAHSSDSIIINWKRVHELLKIFAKGDTILFSQIDLKLIESFRMFLLNAPQGGGKKGVISQNTASTYFSIFKAALKQAFIDGYLTVDIRAKIKGIQGQESRREYLTIEELNRLAQTPCGPLLKRAALFSALTGLRHCDIQKLKWSEIEVFNGGYRLNFTQQKTKGVEYMPISEQAFQLCGERKDGEQLVFAGLPDPSWINRPIKKWVAEAGITKHITYHCARHSVFSFSLKFNSLQNISA